jgi:Flp pilus assembly pilin Flp
VDEAGRPQPLRLVDRFIREDDGQDIVEYALLAAIFGIVAALVLPALSTRMRGAFTTWEWQANYDWTPPNPQ